MVSPDDTVGDLKKLVAAQTGTRADKIVLKKWYAPWCTLESGVFTFHWPCFRCKTMYIEVEEFDPPH